MTGILDSLWRLLCKSPRLCLAALVAAQTAFMLNSRALWFSDEVRYADAYAGLLRGKWLVLNLNGVAYPDKPPLYFWFVWALDKLSTLGDPAAFFLAAAASGLLMVYATLSLGRVLGLRQEVCAGAGLVLLSTLFFAGLMHYSRMDLLFSALITASQAAFCLAFRPGAEATRGRSATLALFLAGLATLTKGPLGLLFPVLTTLLFLAWRGRTREFFSRALLPGLLALVALVLSWVVAAYFIEGPGFLHKIFYEQIFQRATKTFHHAEPFYFYLVAFPPCWLPWTLALAALPVRRLAQASFWRGVWAQRKNSAPESDAKAWLWFSAASGLGLLSLLSGKVVVYILPQLAPLALLMAWALLDDDQASNYKWSRLWTLAGLLFLALAAVATQAERFLPAANTLTESALTGSGVINTPSPLPGVWPVAACFALLGAALLLLRKQNARRVLPALALLVTLWIQPAGLLLAPALDPIMSPKPQAMALKEYTAQGYLPVAHDIYQGIYSYYLGGVVTETNSYEALEKLLAEQNVVLAIKKKKWDAWESRPAGLRIVLTQWLAGTAYHIVVSGAGAGTKNASPADSCCKRPLLPPAP